MLRNFYLIWVLLILTNIAPAQESEFIMPDIDAQPTIGFAPLAVHFNCDNLEDRLQAAVDIYWNFGDGTSSKSLYPTHIYENPGNYTVTIHFASKGTSETQIYKEIIRVYSPEEHAGLLKLKIIDASHTWFKEGWDNLIDRDTFGTNGTVSAGLDLPWAVFEFDDQKVRKIQKVRMLIDTGIGHYSHWTKKFHLENSLTGIYESDFSPFFYCYDKKERWETFGFSPIELKYLKLVIDQPENGYCQIGEFEVYEPVPELDLTNSYLSLHPPFIASGIDSSIITINLADSAGHPVTGVPSSAFHLAVWGGENFCSEIRETTSPGLYSAKFSSFESGFKRIGIRVYGRLIDSATPSGDVPVTAYFTAPALEKTTLEYVDGTKCYDGLGWDNAIDGDLAGDDGTTMAGPHYDDAWVIYKFQDNTVKKVNQFRLLTDSGHPFIQDWVKEFKILISNSTLLNDSFKVVYKGRKDGGNWETIFIKPVPVKYIKMVITKPRKWKVLGEFEVYALPAAVGLKSLPEERRLTKTSPADHNQPGQFELFQNFPNPFSIAGTSLPGTIIRYQLAEASRVTLSIYNMLGQEIVRLTNEQQLAGIHEIRWDGNLRSEQKITAGTYFCRLMIDNDGTKFQKIMKMVVVH